MLKDSSQVPPLSRLSQSFLRPWEQSEGLERRRYQELWAASSHPVSTYVSEGHTDKTWADVPSPMAQQPGPTSNLLWRGPFAGMMFSLLLLDMCHRGNPPPLLLNQSGRSPYIFLSTTWRREKVSTRWTNPNFRPTQRHLRYSYPAVPPSRSTIPSRFGHL